jgi:redox-sensitive bicupin YhaK (pirin superfamily)
MTIPGIAVQRATERFHTELEWLDSWHSFSFAEHFSPDNKNHGLLLVNNDDTVAPGYGFQTHAHRDMEIVTWVLSGRLEHRDSEGNHGILYPGLAQKMSAGSGIRHSEVNPDPQFKTRFVQMWVQPDTEGLDPSYAQRDINDDLKRGGLVPIASGKGHDSAVHINQRDAVLYGARLGAGETVVLPDDRHVHVFVCTGWVQFEVGEMLAQGDAARLTAAGGGIKATGGNEGAEILVWATA